MYGERSNYKKCGSMCRRTWLAGLVVIAIAFGVFAVGNSKDLPRIPRLGVAPSPGETTTVFKLVPPATMKVEPEYRTKMPVYRVVTPDFSEPFISGFVNSVFGTKAARPELIGHSLYVRVPEKQILIEFDREQGSILISNQGFSIGAAPGRLPAGDSLGDPVKAARDLLLQLHIKYSDIEAAPVLDNVKGAGFFTVQFNRKVPGTPFRIVGNRILVNISPNGQWHSVLIEWSDFHRIGDYPIKTIQEAANEINAGHGHTFELEQSSPVIGKPVRCRLYYSGSPCGSAYLQPVFRFDVPGEREEDTVGVEVQAITAEYLSKEYEGITQ